ncbi:MAG TPA: hypothetical protein VHR72_10015 [Gemmataceae bacterium]|jgi:catechol 2,3-dioxygenase-like lactoylglutathione lyase family enzyme|nr:hypothetical protein [Gemmataceae bacterium]
MSRRTWPLVLVLLAIVGCTRQSDPAGPAKPASDPAIVLAPTPTVAAPKGPATLDEALKLLDLRTVPRLPNARLHIVRPIQLIYSAPSTLAATDSQHRKNLLDQSWKLDATPPPPGIDPSSYVYAGFDRLGFRVSLSASKSRTTDGWVDVYLMNHGNVDARGLPQMADAKPVNSNWNYASYKTDAKPTEVVAFYRKELGATGWHEYHVGLAAFHAKEDRHLVGFAQNGVEIFLNIKGEKSAPTLVERSVSLRDRPAVTPANKIPKAATFAEGKKILDLNCFPRLGSSEGHGSSAELTYALSESTELTVTSVEAYYREKLQSQGWSQDDASSDLDDEGRLVFAKEGFLLSCNIRKQDGKIIVRLDNMGNVRAADIPRLPDATERTWEPANDVSYETETPIDKSTEFYRKQFDKLGWKEIEAHDAPDDSRLLVFQQNAIVMKVDLSADRVRLRSQLLGEIVPRPASEVLALHMVDFRNWDRPKEAKVTKLDSANLEYVVAATVMQAIQFHRARLQSTAWHELPQRWKDPELRFEKEGFVVDLRVEPDKNDAKSVAVTLRSRGDVDLRLLPIYDAATADPQSVQEDVRQVSAAPVNADDFATVLQRFGWTKSKSDGAGFPMRLEFRQRLVRLSIDIDPSPDGKASLRFRTWGITAEKK